VVNHRKDMYSDKLNLLPPYLFSSLDELKQDKIKKGVDVINLGVGDPDLPTSSHIIDVLCKAARDPKNHKYPSYNGMQEFREAIVKWYKNRFNVSFDADKEVLALIGSKEGIAHLPLAFLNKDDLALVPDPAYTVYKIGTILAGGIPISMPLLKENDFKPDLSRLNKRVRRSAKILFINYPNNPTSATADENFYKEVVDFAMDNDLIVCNDNAYSEIYFDGYRPPSFLEIKNAKNVGVEFNSLSKTYNMTGWRIGYIVGNEDIVRGLGKVKTNIDSGIFNVVQIAATEALLGDQSCVEDNRRVYKERRDVLVKGLKNLSFDVKNPLATFYVWAKVPDGYDSISFSRFLIDNAGIVVTPGVGFGEYGEGYIRFALTESIERIEECINRINLLKGEGL